MSHDRDKIYAEGKARALKSLKHWKPFVIEPVLRQEHKLTVAESNLAAKEAIIEWGKKLEQDIDFDKQLVKGERDGTVMVAEGSPTKRLEDVPEEKEICSPRDQI